MTTKSWDDIGKIGLIETTNPLSKQSILLTEEEHELYTAIKTAESVAKETMLTEHYDKMQKAIDKFSRLNPRAYMVLVD